VEVPRTSSKFDLTVTLTQAGNELNGNIAYNRALFDEARIRRMSLHLARVLESIGSDSSQSVMAIELLSDQEKRQIVRDFNHLEALYEKTCIHKLFERQLGIRLDAVAVRCDEAALTYGALNRRANHLAVFLRGRGVGLESLVAICMDRSIDMVTGILGILKSGAAYVPLDPAYPKRRLAFMLEDSNAKLLLTHRHLAALFDKTIEVTCIDSDWTDIEALGNPEFECDTPVNSLAYVCYTSGSTGRPK